MKKGIRVQIFVNASIHIVKETAMKDVERYAILRNCRKITAAIASGKSPEIQ